jgi:dipeptidyl aminopeptidase/acylaminoacyl peptidase
VTQFLKWGQSPFYGLRKKGTVPFFAAVLVAHAAAGGHRPAFTLEQAVQTRTIGDVAIAPDGRQAAFALAGHYFGFPVIPRFGEDNNLRVISLDTGEIRQATSGPFIKRNPVFSPSGDRLAYISEDDIWIVGLADGRVTRVTTNGARDGDPTWSPDGKEIAFVSNRGGRADIWAASVDGERHGLRRVTRNESLSESDPQWSPDGRTIAFSGTGPDDHYSQGVFSVAAAGGPERRLTAADEFDHSTPRWSPDGRTIAFLSDRTGYMHVWTMNADGTPARHYDTGSFDSTSPHFAVEPVWSRDGSRILISRNREGRFELLDLQVPTGEARTVASGDGLYREVGFRHDGAVVFSHESAWAPPDLYVRTADQATRQLTFSSHVTFRREHMAAMSRATFRSTDGFEVHAFLMKPATIGPGERLPAIVGLHPNGYGQFYDQWHPFVHYLARSGYVVLLVDQRGSSGYGRAYRTAQIGQWGRGTFEDVKAAAAFIRDQPFVDPARVGVMGLSFGGYQTLLALTRTPSLFRAGVDMMGPTDRRGRRGDRYRALQIGATEEEDPALYERISPITSIADLKAPLLVIHSDADRNVAPEETYRLIDELERHGKVYEAVVYPGEAHGLADPAHQLDSYRRILAFFDRWLSAPAAAASERR